MWYSNNYPQPWHSNKSRFHDDVPTDTTRSASQDFHQSSMENRVQTMDSNIKDLHKEQGQLQTTAKTFQDNIVTGRSKLFVTKTPSSTPTLTTYPKLAWTRQCQHLAGRSRTTSHQRQKQLLSLATYLNNNNHSHDYFEDSESHNDTEDDAIMAPCSTAYQSERNQAIWGPIQWTRSQASRQSIMDLSNHTSNDSTSNSESTYNPLNHYSLTESLTDPNNSSHSRNSPNTLPPHSPPTFHLHQRRIACF
jgi:hypothetical protein